MLSLSKKTSEQKVLNRLQKVKDFELGDMYNAISDEMEKRGLLDALESDDKQLDDLIRFSNKLQIKIMHMKESLNIMKGEQILKSGIIEKLDDLLSLFPQKDET